MTQSRAEKWFAYLCVGIGFAIYGLIPVGLSVGVAVWVMRFPTDPLGWLMVLVMVLLWANVIELLKGVTL